MPDKPLTLMGYPIVESDDPSLSAEGVRFAGPAAYYRATITMSPKLFDLAVERGYVKLTGPGRGTMPVADLLGDAEVTRSTFLPPPPEEERS